MKKIVFFVIVLTMFGCKIALSQDANHIAGGRFLKRIEYNVIIPGMTAADNSYNLDSKSILERILFGNINSPVEFMLENSPEGDDGILAFRILRSAGMNSYQLEIMRAPDIKQMYEARDIISTKVNKIAFPPELMEMISLEGRELIRGRNREADRIKYSDDLYKPYRPKSKTFRIKSKFAEQLHDKMAALIDNFKATGIPPIILDGYEVTFRTVVESEVWSLKIHMPQKNVLMMTNFCRQIIADADAGKPDEMKYIELLEGMDFGSYP
jgi:hypothetical protein